MKVKRMFVVAQGFRRLTVLIVLLFLAGCGGPSATHRGPAEYLESIRNNPVLLEAFVREIPKGGDVHTHLSGIPYAESYLQWAANDGFCISTTSWLIVPPPCADGYTLVSSVITDTNLYNQAIDGLSVRNFPFDPPRYGHDHFFATFSLFGEVSSIHKADMLADAATRAAADKTDYLELLITFQSSALSSLADSHAWDSDLDTDYRALIGGVRGLLETGTVEINDLLARQRMILGCAGGPASPACRVSIRFIQQANRMSSHQRVFTSLLFGAEMAAHDARLVGVDLVSPEDNASSLANYTLHMQMLAFLKSKYPSLNISLHAGELTGNLVAPADLSFHISQAVRTAGARRIGHGVSLKSETNWQDLTAEMARNHIGVAILFTSNAQILGVTGEDHPFRAYLNAGVPVMLGSDDQGVSRGNHTAEFVRAIATYALRWNDVKRLARTSMEQAFVRGNSLWQTFGENPVPIDACLTDRPGGAFPSPNCQSYLNANDKAAEQWRLEGRLSLFENRQW
jgi:adenosine deaminase